jgi:hypothetical protein
MNAAWLHALVGRWNIDRSSESSSWDGKRQGHPPCRPGVSNARQARRAIRVVFLASFQSQRSACLVRRGMARQGPGSGRGGPSAEGTPGLSPWRAVVEFKPGGTLPVGRRTHARGKPVALAVPLSPPTSRAGDVALSWVSPWPAGRTGHHGLGLAPSEAASARRTAAGYADWLVPSG